MNTDGIWCNILPMDIWQCLIEKIFVRNRPMSVFFYAFHPVIVDINFNEIVDIKSEINHHILEDIFVVNVCKGS